MRYFQKAIQFIIVILITQQVFSQIYDSTDSFNALIELKQDTLPLDSAIDIIVLPLYNTNRSDIFYDSLKARASQKNWSRELHNIIVKEAPTEHKNINDNNYDRTNYFDQYTGKYIRNIEIIQLEVFGPSVNDTYKKPKHWSQKLGNALHISTLKSAIRSNLFIVEGECIDPYLLSDNERILRNIPNIQDARIYILPNKDNPDSVDVQILTKDVWPIGLGYEALDIAYGKASLWNNNLLGLGHILHLTTYYNLNRTPKYGYKALYEIPNIVNTFTKLGLSHQNTWNYLSNKAYISRDFITPWIKLGGGFGYENVDQIRNVITIDTTYEDVKSNYEFYDIWSGYSLHLNEFKSNRIRKTLFFTARGQMYHYFKRPYIESNFLHEFHNRQLLLTSIGIAWQGYHSTQLVFGFGDTEDLPFGAMIKLTGGKERSEFHERDYYGATFSYSNYIYKYGFITSTFQVGSFFYDNSIEQGTFNFKLTHFTPLFGNQRHIFRHFINMQYIQGFKRFSDEYIELSPDENIRGINYQRLKGDKRLYFNSELVYYSPHYLYGFRFVYFAFLDVGLINYNKNTLINNDIISSIGIGLRLRNERLVFNTIQLRLSYFPFTSIPESEKEYIELSGSGKVKIPDFANRKPELIEFY